LGEAAARIGFDWPDLAGVLDKFEEELHEFREAMTEADPIHQEEELGDLLFCLVNVARFLRLDSKERCAAPFISSSNAFIWWNGASQTGENAGNSQSGRDGCHLGRSEKTAARPAGLKGPSMPTAINSSGF